jgi:DNA-binding transcriptional regulator YhcF (GntR family)/predicted kinase
MSSSRDRVARSEPLHQQVARNIRNDIEAGVLRDGEVLPSTRELAARWDVSVFTIAEAMKVLAADGLIDTKSRSKRTVRAAEPRRQEMHTTQPHVLLVGGFAGSGKTELGRILARLTGWPILDKDTLTRPVVEGALEVLGLSPNDRESEAYVNIIRPLEYNSLLAGILENVECGNSVIATAPFIRELRDAAWIERTRATFAQIRAIVDVAWVYCDVETMYKYLRHRGAARDIGKLDNWSVYMKSIDIDLLPDAPHSLIDNSASAEPLQTQAKRLLQTILSGA